ncbi:PEP-CTERM sorting domain-containing protein [Lacipirellula sp.]|uniref:PEP-CTERM sorting domain-containing protein n=1 Tax=Lacipirellula sp. TaxID=2691419 RepID=UPI003D09DC18
MQIQSSSQPTTMGALYTFVILAAASFCASSRAATLVGYQSNGGQSISLFVKGGALNDGFNALSLKATGNAFTRVNSGLGAGVPRPAGQAFTYRNRALELDPFDADFPGLGKGWTILGPVINTTEVSFGGGPLGKKITTAGEPRGELFLANLYFAQLNDVSGFNATLTLVNGGNTVLTESLVVPLGGLPPLPEVPEPSSAALLFTAGLAAIATRRRLA